MGPYSLYYHILCTLYSFFIISWWFLGDTSQSINITTANLIHLPQYRLRILLYVVRTHGPTYALYRHSHRNVDPCTSTPTHLIFLIIFSFNNINKKETMKNLTQIFISIVSFLMLQPVPYGSKVYDKLINYIEQSAFSASYLTTMSVCSIC